MLFRSIPEDKIAQYKKDVKGKQRAVEPEPESSKQQQQQQQQQRQQHRKKPRQPQYPLRPILTIQRSQGFVWNQVRLRAALLCPHGIGSLMRLSSGFVCAPVHPKEMFVLFVFQRFPSLLCSLMLLPFTLIDITSSNGPSFMPSSVSSINSAMTEYEVEVVEIRVKEGELKDIIP